MNSLVNPGAIATTSMVKGATRDEVWKSILGYYSDFAGRPLTVNQEVFKSEADTNQRNQAIGYLMYAYGYIKANPMQATDVYTEQCSVSVNAKDLATMAGTLANAGKNPVTGKQVMKAGQRARRAGGHGYGGTLRRLRASGCTGRVSRARAAWAAASSPCPPASSGSPSSRRRWTTRGNSVKAQKAIADVVERARRQSVRAEALRDGDGADGEPALVARFPPVLVLALVLAATGAAAPPGRRPDRRRGPPPRRPDARARSPSSTADG
mgnify:CR=1 FL=1